LTLLLPDSVQTLAFGFCGAGAGQPVGKFLLVGGLLFDQGTDDIGDTLQRVAAQGREALFQKVAQVNGLKAGGLEISHISGEPFAVVWHSDHILKFSLTPSGTSFNLRCLVLSAGLRQVNLEVSLRHTRIPKQQGGR